MPDGTAGINGCFARTDDRLPFYGVVVKIKAVNGESLKDNQQDVIGDMKLKLPAVVKNGMDKRILLEVRDLTIHFFVRRPLIGSPVIVHAADRVNLHVYRGETLGLVGESGSGKTTIGRGVLRLIEPTSGEVFLEDQSLGKLNRKDLISVRKKMQMVFQDPSDALNPRATCRQTLVDALKYAGCPVKERLARALELLESVGLEATDLDKYPHQFSGGQQQRIAIARAMAFKPELLILDEPTASLDVSVKTQVTQLLRDLQNKYDLSYILISHDLSNIKYMADRVAVMYLGQIVEVGDTSEIFNNPRHPYTRILIDSVPVPDPTAIREHSILVGEIPSATAPPKGCRFHTRCPLRSKICELEEPQLIMINNVHEVACHHEQASEFQVVHDKKEGTWR
jgi:oligopeptide/dipeptide ABC transporter ATP-binding protein